jgi:hypothetical protein
MKIEQVHNYCRCIHIKVHFLMMLFLYTNNICIFELIFEIYANLITRMHGEYIIGIIRRAFQYESKEY